LAVSLRPEPHGRARYCLLAALFIVLILSRLYPFALGSVECDSTVALIKCVFIQPY
jgi:hypothetical protein